MPTARARAQKLIADEIERFIENGDPSAVALFPLAGVSNVLISELLRYKSAGWHLELHRGCAALSLPEVFS